MTTRVEKNEKTIAQFCDPSIFIIQNLIEIESLSEDQQLELGRNVRHLQLFDYPAAQQAIEDGLAVLATYNS
jgi:hypothetical protein